MSPALARGQNSPENTKLQPHDRIRAYFDTLYRAWGPQHWWPGQSPFEVIVGAYLTQNTSWTNVELALANLRRARILNVDGVRRTPVEELEKLIRSAGYFRQKARRLKIFVKFLDEHYAGSLPRMFAQPTAKLREELLSLNGIGPETADSILLYAGNHSVFVVDAYTRRIIERHQLAPTRATYEEIRDLFENALPPLEANFPVLGPLVPQVRELPLRANLGTIAEVQVRNLGAPSNSCHPPSKMSTAKRTSTAQVFNEMHGLIVGVGKNFCKKSQPDCEHCPLKNFLPVAQ